MNLTPAQRTALRGMAAPVLLVRHFSLDYYSREPSVTWFLYCPDDYHSPEFWSLEGEEGEALVDAGLVAGVESIYPDCWWSKVQTYRITEAGRSAVDGKLKPVRRRKEISIAAEIRTRDEGGSVPRGAGGERAAAADPQRAVQDSLPI